MTLFFIPKIGYMCRFSFSFNGIISPEDFNDKSLCKESTLGFTDPPPFV